jgi:signal transduction histidine kinase
LYYISAGSFFRERFFLPLRLFFFGSFAFAVALQIYIFKKKILTRLGELHEVKKIVAEQEKGAQLLVRRDLELTRANERLRRLDEMKSNFISVVAHQLRTPLSGVKWTLNLLLSGDIGGELPTEQRTYLFKAYESNERMIALVNDMLRADRIESAKIHYSFQPLQLLDLFDNILFELLPQAEKKGIRIRFERRPPELRKVSADPERIRAVLQNLIENSVRYSRTGGVVELGVKDEGDEVLVFVKDEGIGIPKDQQQHIFERFFRARNAIKTETEGSGLGLFIVKSIIERHGGKIWFEGEEGKGVTFYFTLPVARTSETRAV